MTPLQLAQIHASAFENSRAWSASEFEELLESKTVFLFAKPQGFALGRIAGGEAELLTIAVEPATRRLGIGRKLLAEYEQEASDQNCTQSFLEVDEHNLAAISMYQSEGYSLQGLRKNYYKASNGQTSSALVMSKDLKS